MNWKLDEELSELANFHRGRYSRYCDDVAFSFGDTGVGDMGHPGSFCRQVEDFVRCYGYQIQSEKGWMRQTAEKGPEITGVMLDGRRLRMPERVIRKMKAIRRWFYKPTAAERQRLNGYRGFQKMLKQS